MCMKREGPKAPVKRLDYSPAAAFTQVKQTQAAAPPEEVDPFKAKEALRKEKAQKMRM